LVAPEKAKQVVDTFRGTYDKLNHPRVLIYVNRELIDEHSGLKLTRRREHSKSTVAEQNNKSEGDASAAKSSAPAATNTYHNEEAPAPGKGSSESKSTTVTSDNTYTATEAPTHTLADKQTVREVERLFGRPFRYAGATLADQKVASSLIADQPLDHFMASTNESARKDREALTKVADVVIEILLSSRNLSIPAVSGDQSVPIPDIQVTAIRLSDSAVIGQASASDILGKDQQAGRIARHIDVRDVTEATALALMEDISTTTK
jgi:hypothetical protein